MLAKDNNIDFLRAILAFSVVLHHYIALTGAEYDIPSFFELINSKIAVKSFFVLSGFLIWHSCKNSLSFRRYMYSRVARLFPALIFVLLITCLVAYFTLDTSFSLTAKYFLSNVLLLGFISPSIGDIAHALNIDALNGSLWTLKVEFSYYIAVAIILYKFRSYALRIVIISTLLSFVMHTIALNVFGLSQSIVNQLPFIFYYFGVGVIFYEYCHLFTRKRVILAFLFSLIAHLLFPCVEFFQLAFVLFFVLIISFCLPFNLRRHFDLSYGMYVYHFPLIQFVLIYELIDVNYWVHTMLLFFSLLLISCFSWFYIESPSVNFVKRNLVKNKVSV